MARMVSEEATTAGTVYRIVTECLPVETVTTVGVITGDLAQTAGGTAMAEGTVSVVVNRLARTGHRRMDSVETEVVDRPAATEHLVEEMDSVVEATELARMGLAVAHPVATARQKVGMVSTAATEADLRRVSMVLLEEMEETAETVATVDDRRAVTEHLTETEVDHRVVTEHPTETEVVHRVVTEHPTETEVDHRVCMDHRAEMETMVVEMEDITVAMVAMVDIHQVDRVVTEVAIHLEVPVGMADILLEVPVGMADILLEVRVGMVDILLVVLVVMAEATAAILPDRVETMATTVMEKMKVTNQQSTSSLTKSRTNNLELITAIRRAEMEIVHRESLMYCFPMEENKSLSTRPIKMDLNLKLDTKVKQIIKDTVLADQEAMVEIMDTQVVDPTGVELEAMVIRQEDQAEDLTSVMEDIHLEDQVVTMEVTETETMVATVMEDIHPEVVATPRLTEDTSTKYSSRCSNIYRAYYRKGIHRATFIITHRIVSVWNSNNAAVTANDGNFSKIESLCRCLFCLIVLEHFQLNADRNEEKRSLV